MSNHTSNTTTDVTVSDTVTSGTRPSKIVRRYDVVVVGARAAGASTAMLLARQGANVLLVDRARKGSDTLSTHALMRGAVARLADWGLLGRVWNADTPIIQGVGFTYGEKEVSLDVRPEPGVEGLAAPRRTVLDPILVDAAEEAGVTTLFETSLVDLTRDRSGRVDGVNLKTGDGILNVAASLVIGADGLRSSVARMVEAPVTRRGSAAGAYSARYYTDTGLPTNQFHWLYNDKLGAGVIPTNGGHCVFTARPQARFRAEKANGVDRMHMTDLGELSPAVADAVRGGTPTGPIRSFPGVPGQFRKPWGDGWALVGDAGYFKDPFAAHGITDAFRDAELVVKAWATGRFDLYETERDARSLPLFNVLEQIASFEWTLEELPGLHFELSKAMRTDDHWPGQELSVAA